MQGWDVCGNDCYIMGPPGDLCAALLGRNWSSGAALGSGWQGTRWAGVCSSFRVRSCWPSSTLNFPYLLADGAAVRRRRREESSHRRAVQGGWMLGAVWK